MHTYMHACIPTCMHACIHTQTHTYSLLTQAYLSVCLSVLINEQNIIFIITCILAEACMCIFTCIHSTLPMHLQAKKEWEQTQSQVRGDLSDDQPIHLQAEDQLVQELQKEIKVCDQCFNILTFLNLCHSLFLERFKICKRGMSVRPVYSLSVYQPCNGPHK